MLKKNNYHTAAFTGGGDYKSIYGFDRGFDIYDDERNFSEISNKEQQVKSWLRQNSKNKFFLFIQGLLKFKYDKNNEMLDIDWEKTKVAFLQMDNIYIDPNGLGGNWERASGKEYEKLRNEVIKILKNELKDDNGQSPVAAVVKWEDVEDFLDLPKDRVGDLIIANKAGYNWRSRSST